MVRSFFICSGRSRQPVVDQRRRVENSAFNGRSAVREHTKPAAIHVEPQSRIHLTDAGEGRECLLAEIADIRILRTKLTHQVSPLKELRLTPLVDHERPVSGPSIEIKKQSGVPESFE